MHNLFCPGKIEKEGARDKLRERRLREGDTSGDEDGCLRFFVRQCMLIESSASSRKYETVSYAFTRRQRGEIALIPLSSYVRDSFW